MVSMCERAGVLGWHCQLLRLPAKQCAFFAGTRSRIAFCNPICGDRMQTMQGASARNTPRTCGAGLRLSIHRPPCGKGWIASVLASTRDAHAQALLTSRSMTRQGGLTKSHGVGMVFFCALNVPCALFQISLGCAEPAAQRCGYGTQGALPLVRTMIIAPVHSFPSAWSRGMGANVHSHKLSSASPRLSCFNPPVPKSPAMPDLCGLTRKRSQWLSQILDDTSEPFSLAELNFFKWQLYDRLGRVCISCTRLLRHLLRGFVDES